MLDDVLDTLLALSVTQCAGRLQLEAKFACEYLEASASAIESICPDISFNVRNYDNLVPVNSVSELI